MTDPLNPNTSAYYVVQIFFLCVLPFLVFFIGVFVRKFGLPSQQSPPLPQLLLLSIPVSLVIVSPFILLVPLTLEQAPRMALTLGIIMEHGMVVPEILSAHLRKALGDSAGGPPVQQSA